MATKNQILAEITAIKTDAHNFNQRVHKCALDIFDRSQVHGDCSQAQLLVMALPRSFRRLALIEWFSRYTPIVTKDSEDWESKMHKPESKLYRPFERESADANPWFQIAENNPERKKKVWTFDAFVQFIANKAAEMDKKADNGDIPEEDVESIKAMTARLSAMKFERVEVKAPPAEAETDDDSTAPNNVAKLAEVA